MTKWIYMLRYLCGSCCEHWRQYGDGSYCQANRKYQGRKSVIIIILKLLQVWPTFHIPPHYRDSNSCGNSILRSCHNCCCYVSWTPISSHWSSPWVPLGESSCVPHRHHRGQCTRGTSGYSHCKWKALCHACIHPMCVSKKLNAILHASIMRDYFNCVPVLMYF